MSVVWEIMTRHLYFISHAFNLRIHAFVLMPNHIHLIVRAPDGNISAAMAYFNTSTAKELCKESGRINHIYGSRFHRTVITSPLYYMHAYKYVYRNPVTAGLCQNVEDYPYSSINGLLGKTWLEVPVQEDDNWGSLNSRESTLEWLNSAPPKEHLELVRIGLKKSEFVLGKINRQPSSLELRRL